MSVEKIKSIINQELATLPASTQEQLYERIKAALQPRKNFNVTAYFSNKVKENNKSSLLLAIAGAAITRINETAIEYAKTKIAPELEHVSIEDCLKLFVKASRAIVSNEETLSTIEAPLFEQVEEASRDPFDDLD